jgi:small subunit ribosomal protein S6
VKRYEALVIIKQTVREDQLKDVIDKVSAEITAAGGKVETVQKMDRKPFSRIADRKQTAGFYTNFIFEAPAPAVAQLRHKLGQNEDVFRAIFTEAAPPSQQQPEALAAGKA